jgi:Ca2+/Na+ antiporter
MPNEELLEMLIPITLFVVTFLVVWVVVLFRYRAKRDIQVTYRAAIEQGQELTPELLERLGERQPKNRDLRRGVVSLFIGLAFVVFGLILGEEDAVRPMIAVGVFPILLGAAYLGLWTLSRKDS